MKFGLVVSDNPKAKKLAGEVKTYIASKKHTVGEDKLTGVDVVVTLGGDGTLLHAASRHAELGVPFVGINVGTLGFLTAEEADGWKTAIDKLIAGKYVTSERIILNAQIQTHSRSVQGSNRAHSGSETRGIFQAVNEIVVKGLYRVVDIEIYVSGSKFLEIVGDGVIVATQTGSTAYSLSSGGPIVDPDLDCLLVTPINPIGLPIPSVVLSPNDVVEIKVLKGDDVSLIGDGQKHIKISQSQSVKVKRGEHKVKFIFFDEHKFISSLEAKFGLASRLVR